MRLLNNLINNLSTAQISITSKIMFALLLFFFFSCTKERIRLEKFQTAKNIDVIIYSATPAGITSAVAAARKGKKVLIIEPSKKVGGIISAGLTASDVCREQLIGGLSLEFFERVGSRYGEPVKWRFEPHVAEEEFIRLLNEEKISVLKNASIASVYKVASTIDSIKLSNGKIFKAKIFIDASYEGDLLYRAGISYSLGRESAYKYSEGLGGRPEIAKVNQWDMNLSGLDENKKPLPGVSLAKLVPKGAKDSEVMAYNFRPCLTKNLENSVRFKQPLGYRAKDYELLARYLKKRPHTKLSELLMFLPTVRGKVDVNSKGPFSTDILNGSKLWIKGTKNTRKKLYKEYKKYTQGLFYFLANDKAVPKKIRDNLSKWGLCKDEFVDNNNWPHQLYVRVGRRLVGEYVLRESDLIGGKLQDDAVAWSGCRIEIHHSQRLIDKNGYVYNEGNVGFKTPPYQIPYRSITPKKSEAVNLLVPVSMSASNLAYSSARMEPVFMSLGHAAGVAASMAIDNKLAVQDVDSAKLKEILNTERAGL